MHQDERDHGEKETADDVEQLEPEVGENQGTLSRGRRTGERGQRPWTGTGWRAWTGRRDRTDGRAVNAKEIKTRGREVEGNS